MNIPDDWKQHLKTCLATPEFLKLEKFVDAERSQHTTFPKNEHVFRALLETPFDKVRVVILGQDPYHNDNQAMGLAFSVPEESKLPPSLKNIYKEIKRDTQKESICAPGGDLTLWARQGVLLLNSVLTVRSHEPASHKGQGWEGFTDCVVQQLSDQHTNLVFLLWGAYAQKKGQHIDRKKHLVLEASHPSPLGCRHSFEGCAHFSQTNKYLSRHGYSSIDW